MAVTGQPIARNDSDGVPRFIGVHTAHDTTEITAPVNWVSPVDADGDVAVIRVDNGTTAETVYMFKGYIYPARNIKIIKNTGSTATKFALYQ